MWLDPPILLPCVRFSGSIRTSAVYQLEMCVKGLCKLCTALREASVIFIMCGDCSASAQQARPNEIGCVPVEKLFTEVLPRNGGKEWLAHQLKRDGQAWHLIFTQKTSDSTSAARVWVLASRLSADRPEVYCIEGIGSRVDVLASLHDSKFDEKFGMPGSNNPRCGPRGDALEGLKVRGWASRELGESLILSLDDPRQGAASHVLLMSKIDNHWVLLNKRAGSTTCYLDRGNAHDARAMTLR
jgi:hypothetical protein